MAKSKHSNIEAIIHDKIGEILLKYNPILEQYFRLILHRHLVKI